MRYQVLSCVEPPELKVSAPIRLHLVHAGGLTILQRQQIAQSFSSFGSHEENLWSFIKFVASDLATEGLNLVEEFAALAGPVLGAIGPLIAVSKMCLQSALVPRMLL